MVGRWTEALILDLRARREAGESLLNLAEEHCVSKQRMHQLLAGPVTRNEIIWTDAMGDQLCALWDDGHSAAEIGRRMGNISKNSVISKARRLKLSKRDSPITNQVSWTLERREELKEYVAKGIGDTEIAKRMGLSVHAVFSQRKARGYVRPSPDKIVKPRPVVKKIARPVVVKKPVRPVLVKPVPPPTPIIELPLLELNWRYQQPTDSERLCKWPFNNGRPWKFCCEMRAGVVGPYCAGHARVAVKVDAEVAA